MRGQYSTEKTLLNPFVLSCILEINIQFLCIYEFDSLRYLIGLTVAETVVTFLTTIFLVFPLYWLVGLQPTVDHFLYFWWVSPCYYQIIIIFLIYQDMLYFCLPTNDLGSLFGYCLTKWRGSHGIVFFVHVCFLSIRWIHDHKAPNS